MDCRRLAACGKHYTASYVYSCNKVKVQMTFTNCFARRLNMLHEHTLVMHYIIWIYFYVRTYVLVRTCAHNRSYGKPSVSKLYSDVRPKRTFETPLKRTSEINTYSTVRLISFFFLYFFTYQLILSQRLD